MYVQGEGLQWYDPALLFPLRPLGGSDDDDINAFNNSPAYASRTSSQYYSDSPAASAAPLPPAAVAQRVQQRARELLLDRLSGETLSSDAGACASVTALLKSLQKGEPVHLSTSSGPHARPSGGGNNPAATSTAGSNSSSRGRPQKTNPLGDFVQRGGSAVPATLSGATSAQPRRGSRRDRRRGTLTSYMNLFGTDAAGDGGLAELLDSDSASADGIGRAADDAVDDDGFDYEDDDLSFGGWSGLQGSSGGAGRGADGGTSSTTAAAAHQARRLRDYFAALPPQLGVQEEAVLCPLNLQTDPLAHIAAAAEVFAVVTTAVPQVLYVFDQLNNIPISSNVLGGSSFHASGAAGASAMADGQASMRHSLALRHGSAALALSSVTPLTAVSCTIAPTDLVQHLWLDPSGHYCVIVFASGKCVYFYLPRRPTTTAAGDANGAAGATSKRGRSRDTHGGLNDDAGEGEEDETSDVDAKPQRRQQRHKEWKEAARRWLRIRRRRRSSSDDDSVDGEADGGGHSDNRDAAYRPRGFSLTLALPSSSADSGFAPSCVGWCRDAAPFSSSHEGQNTTMTAAAAAAVYRSSFNDGAAAATTSPRGILKTAHRSGSAAASKQLGFHTGNTPGCGLFASSQNATSPATVGALLGGQRGGALVACVLTPAGAMDSRTVFQFPPPMAEASIDSVAAVRAPPAASYGDDSHDSCGGDAGGRRDGDGHAEGGREKREGGAAAAAAAEVRAASASRRIHWDHGGSQPEATSAHGMGGNTSDGVPVFPRYAHTPHFLSVDDNDNRGDGAGHPPLSSMDDPLRSSASRPRADVATPSPRCRWVVLVSVRNRLYVFATPSTTTDFSELEEIRDASIAAAGLAGDSSVPAAAASTITTTRSLLVRSAVESQLTGRVEDAFLLYTRARSTQLSENGGSPPLSAHFGDAYRGAAGGPSLTTTGDASFTRPPLPPPAAAESGEGRPPHDANAQNIAVPCSRVVADELQNFITVEEAALSTCSMAAAYAAGPSEVHTTVPQAEGSNVADASAEAPSASLKTSSKKGTSKKAASAVSPAAPFLLHSTTRGTLHIVLPPLPQEAEKPGSASATGGTLHEGCSTDNKTSASSARVSGGGGGRVLPASLPPVFYWQYGDVLVHGILLCGAGGLEVGAKVRALVHHDVQGTQTASMTGTLSPAYGRGAGKLGHTGRDEVTPMDVAATSSASMAHVSGLEAGLTHLIGEALHTTQDLNVFADVSAEDGAAASVPPGHEASSSRSPAAKKTPAVAAAAPSRPGGGARGMEEKAAQPTVLPIGLLSVVNVNSCVQSLRGLLEAVSLTRGRDQQRAGTSRGITFSHCTLRTGATAAHSLRSDAVVVGAAATAGLDTRAACAIGSGADPRRTARAAGQGVDEQASLAATALQHPLLQFPWTTRLQLSDSSRKSRAERSSDAAAERYSAKRHHRHRGQRSRGQPSSPTFADAPSPSALFATAMAQHSRIDSNNNDNSPHRDADVGLPAATATLVEVPLLDGALARGDVDADAVRRLRAVARAYVARSPVVFDAPVDAVLRATAASAAAPSSAARGGAVSPNVAAAAAAAATVTGSPSLAVVGRSATTTQAWPSVSPPSAQHSREHSRSSSLGQPVQRASSAMLLPLHELADRHTGEANASAAPATSTTDTPPSAASQSRVELLPRAEVLVSLAAHYSHLVITTTQGVYVLAHAAALPLEEAAMAWRQKLVYHAVTTRAAAAVTPSTTTTTTTTTTVATPSAAAAAAPLFTAASDAAAPEMFYLASPTRVVRLQVPALRSTAPGGRWQFVMQLLAKAQEAASHRRASAPASTLTETLPQRSSAERRTWVPPGVNVRGRTTGNGGRDDRTFAAAAAAVAGTADAREVSAVVADAIRDASAAVTVESVVVPSSLAYEVRVKGLLGRGHRFTDRDADAGGGDEDRAAHSDETEGRTSAYGRPRLSPRHHQHHQLPQQRQQQQRASRTHSAASSSVDGAGASWQSSPLPSRSSSARRSLLEQLQPLNLTTGASSGGAASTGGSRSDMQSTGPSPFSSAHLPHDTDADPFVLATTLPTSPTQPVDGLRRDSGNVDTATHLHGSEGETTHARAAPPLRTAQHFLRHANRRALQLPTQPSSSSLAPNDSFDPALSPAPHTSPSTQQWQHPATLTAVPIVSVTAEGESTAASPASAAPTAATFHSNPLRQDSFFGGNRDDPLFHLSPSSAGTTTSYAAFTQYASPLQQSPPSTQTDARRAAAEPATSRNDAQATAADAGSAAAVAALGAASRAEDRELVTFLAANPLLHFLLQRSGAAGRKGDVVTASSDGARSVATSLPFHRRLSARRSRVAATTRAINVPGFGLLPGSVGLTPLTAAGSRAVASLLLQRSSYGVHYYCADHLYEMALSALTTTLTNSNSTPFSAAGAACRPVAMTREDRLHLHLVRHAYGSYLLSQQRFLEAAVQFGKAADGPTPLPTLLVEFVRAFRESNSLEPLLLFLQLRLRGYEESGQGLGGHSLEVSVLATWLLSLLLEQCSVARARQRRYEAKSTTCAEAAAAAAPTQSISEGNAVDFTRVAWIRQRYHLDSPAALLEDALLRYGRFIDSAVLSSTVARLASAHESVLVSELQGRPADTVMSLVLREQNFLAGLLRLQALLADPSSQSLQTRQLLQMCIDCHAGGGGARSCADGNSSLDDKSGTAQAAAAALLHARGTIPLMTVFYGGASSVDTMLQRPIPIPRDAAALPRLLATLFERLSTLFLCCYPCRFVQDGLQALLHQRQDVPLPPRRLLPALLTYCLANNESVFEATASPVVVLRALAQARAALQRQQQTTYFVFAQEHHKRQTKKKKKMETEASMRRDAERGRDSQRNVKNTMGKPKGKDVPPAAAHVAAAHGTPELSRQQPSTTQPASRMHAEHEAEASARPSTHNPPVAAPAGAPSSASSLFNSSLSFPADVSHHDTRAFGDPNNVSLLAPEGPPSPFSPGPTSANADYDRVLLDDSSSDEVGGVDEDIVLPALSHTGTSAESSVTSAQTTSTSISVASSATVTPSSPRRHAASTAPSSKDGSEREQGAQQRTGRHHSAEASTSSANEESGRGSARSSEAETSRHLSDQVRPITTHSASSESSTASSSTSPSVTDEATDVVAQLLDSAPPSSSPSAAALSLSLTTSTNTTNASNDEETDEDEEEDAYDSDTYMGDWSPLLRWRDGGGGVTSGELDSNEEQQQRAATRMLRARQKRDVAALQLRRSLVPTLTPAAVAAAAPNSNAVAQTASASLGSEGAAMEHGDNLDELHAVSHHAVLSYLEDLVVLAQQQHGALAGQLDGDADVAIFVIYVNVLARDGEEEALQRFAEQTAVRHTHDADARWAAATTNPTASDAAVAAAGSSYRLLHVLRLCASHQRWAGCVWMYYALGYHREAIALSLRCVVGEEGVRLAVRLLQLLHERDRRRGQTARACEAHIDHAPASRQCTAAGESDDVADRADTRAARRDLWMLVARHLIQGGGHTKHGAQTALQLSLRSGGGTFDVTDVLPELPDSLFMAELKEELLSSVRELSRTMRGLRQSTNALSRDTRVLHRELQAMSHHPLTMQVDERCVLCGQPALARPFTVYPRCHHLIHTACYHHARQEMLRRGADSRDSAEVENVSFQLYDSARRRGAEAMRPVSAPLDRNGGRSDGGVSLMGREIRDSVGGEGEMDSMECLLCSRRYLRNMLDAPLGVPLVGDDTRQSTQRTVLR